jgi:hypothetical protein
MHLENLVEVQKKVKKVQKEMDDYLGLIDPVLFLEEMWTDSQKHHLAWKEKK